MKPGVLSSYINICHKVILFIDKSCAWHNLNSGCHCWESLKFFEKEGFNFERERVLQFSLVKFKSKIKWIKTLYMGLLLTRKNQKECHEIERNFLIDVKM